MSDEIETHKIRGGGVHGHLDIEETVLEKHHRHRLEAPSIHVPKTHRLHHEYEDD